MGWTAPRQASMCQNGRCHNPSEESRRWGSLSTICRLSRSSGSTSPRKSFRCMALTPEGRWGRQGGSARAVAELFRIAAAMRDGNRSVQFGARLGALADRTRPSGEVGPPAYVKPYVRRNKNDAVDAVAICETVGRPNMRFVPVRSVENQARLMRHRARELLMGHCTRMLNALRGHLGEIGVVAALGAE